jgi:outer membrane protein OmpA-like peptidoglycan-associated protein
MKHFKITMTLILMSALLVLGGCKSMSKTQKGAVVGTAAGGTMGAVIGKSTGNTALGAIIGATVGGTAGAIIGNQMDKQAEEIKKAVPDAEVIRVGEGIMVEFNSSILFAFGKSTLTNEAQRNLDEFLKVLEIYPETDIEVQGHTDNVGSEAFNQTLSEQRAATVSNYLVNRGIRAHRLTIIGYGELLPKYLNDTDAGREKNRRVEFLITANEKMKAEAEKQAG